MGVSSDDIGLLGGTKGVDGTLGETLDIPLHVFGVLEGATTLDEFPLVEGVGCWSGLLGVGYWFALIESRSSSSTAILMPAMAIRCGLEPYSEGGGLRNGPQIESENISQETRFFRRRSLLSSGYDFEVIVAADMDFDRGKCRESGLSLLGRSWSWHELPPQFCFWEPSGP